jgi:general secretion pathway protein B
VSAPPTDVPLPAPLVGGPRAAESVAAPKPSGPQAGPAGDDILSKLKLTVHVYAENPPDRLVFINGTKYVQGDRIDGKALVEEITQDGAVVSFEGRRAVLRH